MARRTFKAQQTDGTVVYYYTDNDQLTVSVGDCILPSLLTVDTNAINYNASQLCTSTNIIRQGYSWNSATGNKGYTVYAYVTDNINYSTKLTPLSGQNDVTPNFSVMETGSWVGPNGLTWNRRLVIPPVFSGGAGVAAGNWKQIILNTISNVADERLFTLTNGQDINNLELINATVYYQSAPILEREMDSNGVTVTATPTVSQSISQTVNPTPTPTVNSTPTTPIQNGSLLDAIGVKPTYSGQIDSDYSAQYDTNVLKLEVVEVNSNGLIRLANNASGKNPTNGSVGKYHINSNMYVDDISNRWFEPYQALLVTYLWVNPNTPDYTWQAVGAGTESFFKSFSLINFK